MNSVTIWLAIEMKITAPRYWQNCALMGIEVLRDSILVVFPQIDIQDVNLKSLQDEILTWNFLS